MTEQYQGQEDFEWFCTADKSEYIGQYVAVWNKSIAGHGNTIKEAYDMAKAKYPGSQPLLAWVPDREAMLF